MAYEKCYFFAGSSKRNAKSAAAKIALAKLISYTPMDGMLNNQSDLGGLNMTRESILKADGIGRYFCL